jgi:hypothetical protein
MTTLSPLDALGPAFRRTREVMAQPFRFGFFLKIALIAALTQPSFYSASISYPIQGAQFTALRGLGHRHGIAVLGFGNGFVPGQGFAVFGIVALVAAGLIGVLIWIGIAYLYCRLRFTLFDLVVYKRGRVGQAWSGYGRQAWRYFGLVVLAGLGFMVLALIVIGPAALNFVRAVGPLAKAGPNLDPFALMGSILPFLIAIFVVAALWAVVDTLMQDFLLPPMAVEDAPLESAFGRFFHLLKTEFWPVVVYVLLRFAVGIGLTWMLMLVIFIVLLLAGLAVFGAGTLLYHLLWSSVAGQVICVALALLVGLITMAVYLTAIISVYGVSAVFKQSYAAYFFGGRYAALGDRLEPPPPLPSFVEPLEPPPGSPPPSSGALPPLSDAPAMW